MKKYFVVSNRFLACGINYMSGENYKHFYDSNGKDIFSFPNTKKVKESYIIMNKYHYNEV